MLNNFVPNKSGFFGNYGGQFIDNQELLVEFKNIEKREFFHNLCRQNVLFFLLNYFYLFCEFLLY